MLIRLKALRRASSSRTNRHSPVMVIRLLCLRCNMHGREAVLCQNLLKVNVKSHDGHPQGMRPALSGRPHPRDWRWSERAMSL